MKGYPDDWALPEHAMRRGSLLNVKGDPLTPGWPSTGSEVILKFSV